MICRKDAVCYPHPSQRSSGGNSYQGGYGNGSVGVILPEKARAVRSAGYGQGTLDRSQAQYRPNAPFHTGTPANLQRPQFDNWSSKKSSLMGEFGTGSKIVYWGDLKERDDKMRAMRIKYELNDSRRALIREVMSRESKQFNLQDPFFAALQPHLHSSNCRAGLREAGCRR